METGYFIPMSLTHKLSIIWSVIILSFDRILVYELNYKSNMYLNILAIALSIIFVTLVWPYRFVIVDAKIHFNTFPSVRMKNIDLSSISMIRITKFGFEFSHHEKKYYFFTFGKSKEILCTLKNMIEPVNKINDVRE